jgi:dTDP-4-dehydrorhamnose reductase
VFLKYLKQKLPNPLAITSSNKRKKVLITGANGLVGQKILGQLILRDDFEIIASGLGVPRLPALWCTGYRWISLDISHRIQVNEVLLHERPDFVIHAAAMTQVDQCEQNQELCWTVNVTAVSYLVEACKEISCHFIHLSTDFIFDGTSGPYSEDDLPNPVNFYGKSKLAAEKIIIDSEIRQTIIRTVLVYGLGHDLSRSNLILWVKSSLEHGKKIKVVNDQWRTPTLAEDLAWGCIAIMDHGATGIFNISGECWLTPYDMALQVVDFFNLNKTLIEEVSAATFVEPAKRPPKTGLVIEKAKTMLNYRPKSFMDGIGILAKQLKLANCN